ncbi:MAG: hypothetical protein EOP83_06055 [Verrucomicrobiaceae bacterium]|nr:MAG: hypothetical protein EOP83_06055 [Verrucomicrobiaceae bacterium]
MTLKDDAYLDIPAERSPLEWWFECVEQNGETSEPTYEYVMYVGLTKEAANWCDASLTATPDFQSEYRVTEDFMFEPIGAVLTQICQNRVRMNFVTQDDMFHFKLRWL